MRKALFFPSYAGGGFGHISRTLALAAALQERGWRTSFVLGGQHVERVRQILEGSGSPDNTVYPLRRLRPAPAAQDGPAFTVISNANYQIVRDGLVHPAIIRASVAEQLGIIRAFEPDVLIGDVWPLASVLSRLAGVPLVQITRSILHPAAPNLLWWQEPSAGLVPPDPRPLLNPLLRGWGLPPIERAEDLLDGDLHLVPSIPLLDPLPPGLPDTVYVGPLTRPLGDPNADRSVEQYVFQHWLESLEPGQPLVYVTTGGGAGSVGSLAFYRALLEAFEGTGIQAVVSTGARISPQDLPAPPSNVRLESWVPGPEVIARSRLVVYSGGYGTTMEIVRAGVPGLVIPSHSEQESNGRRLEAAGAARVLLPARGEPEVVAHTWPGGRFTTLIYPHSDLTPELLREQILEAAFQRSLGEGARNLQAQTVRYQGAARAAELVEALVERGQPAHENGWRRLNWWQKLRLHVSGLSGR